MEEILLKSFKHNLIKEFNSFREFQGNATELKKKILEVTSLHFLGEQSMTAAVKL